MCFLKEKPRLNKSFYNVQKTIYNLKITNRDRKHFLTRFEILVVKIKIKIVLKIVYDKEQT